MDTDPRLIRELRRQRYLTAMAIVWAALCITLGFPFGALLAGLGFLLLGGSYLADSRWGKSD